MPDRSHLLTEQLHPDADTLDALDTSGLLTRINDADRAVPDAVARAIPALTALADAALAGMRGGGRLIYVGAGTSGRLGVLDASEVPPTFSAPPTLVRGVIAGGDAALRVSSEGLEDDRDGALPRLIPLRLGPSDTLVGIAAGGTTPYVQGGIDHANAQGCTTAMICCTAFADLRLPDPAAPDHVVELLVGPEVVAGSTRMKAGTATKLALNMLSTTLMIQLGKTWRGRMVDVRATNAKLRDRAERTLVDLLAVDRGDAAALLDAAGGSVKLALVMHERGVDHGTAEALLADADGHVDRVMERLV